eukprot:3507354-Alexandrium_andersonii.AAC.1
MRLFLGPAQFKFRTPEATLHFPRSSHRKVPKSAIRSPPKQPKSQYRTRCSELRPRGPRNDLR